MAAILREYIADAELWHSSLDKVERKTSFVFFGAISLDMAVGLGYGGCICEAKLTKRQQQQQQNNMNEKMGWHKPLEAQREVRG